MNQPRMTLSDAEMRRQQCLADLAYAEAIGDSPSAVSQRKRLDKLNEVICRLGGNAVTVVVMPTKGNGNGSHA